MPASELIAVEGLVKDFGKTKVLQNINVTISKGEVVAVIGPSGSGKSTFLRCLNLLEQPTGGHIFFEGVDICDKKTDINLHRQKIGMVFQQFNLFNNMTVLRNITAAPIKVKGLSKQAAEAQAMQLLERVSKMGITVLVVTHEHELVHRFHQRVVTLSHGRIVSDVPADPVAAAEDDLSLDVAAFDADDASAAKKEVAAV